MLPWPSRHALVDQIGRSDSLQRVRVAFEAVGTSRPVELAPDEKDALVHVIETWGGEVDGWSEKGLPAGILELRNALYDDLHDSREPGGKLNTVMS